MPNHIEIRFVQRNDITKLSGHRFLIIRTKLNFQQKLFDNNNMLYNNCLPVRIIFLN